MKLPCKFAVATLLTIGFVLTGCSNSDRPPTYPVTGTVTAQGKPVAGAAITFVPTGKDGEAASAITDSEGKYALTTWDQGDGARPGQYRVKVSKVEQQAVDPSNMVRDLPYEEEQRIYKEAPTNYDPTARPTPPPKSLIPIKYENDETSGLTHTAQEKATTFDIKIE